MFPPHFAVTFCFSNCADKFFQRKCLCACAKGLGQVFVVYSFKICSNMLGWKNILLPKSNASLKLIVVFPCYLPNESYDKYSS